MTATAPVASKSLIPPEEKFWQRYSPHNEAPLSGVTSTVIHALVIGLLLLIVYVRRMTQFDDANRSLPVDLAKFSGGKDVPVDIKIDRDGGGVKRPEPPLVPPLSAEKQRGIQEQFPDDPTAKYYAEKGGSQPAFDWLGLEKGTRETLRQGPNPGIGGGPNKDRAGGPKDGFRPINEIECRILRWEVTFKTSNGADYLKQLASFGAKICIPIEGKEGQFLVVEDLKNPRVAVQKDVTQLGLIYWIDTKRESVNALYSVVPHHQATEPKYFVAFFPKWVHDRLLDLEMDHAARTFNGLREEKRIRLTQFEVFPSGSRYDFRVTAMLLKN